MARVKKGDEVTFIKATTKGSSVRFGIRKAVVMVVSGRLARVRLNNGGKEWVSVDRLRLPGEGKC